MARDGPGGDPGARGLVRARRGRSRGRGRGLGRGRRRGRRRRVGRRRGRYRRRTESVLIPVESRPQHTP
ncbi:MAG: hypothetical protein E6K52_12535 [Gammaproteobacteria bacterium]|nr:MAG: hypothetical protein E6K52_12535 [Gammaproteobacteria bacterium]